MKKADRVGEVFSSVHGTAVIKNYYTNEKCTVQFEDGTFVHNLKYDHVKKGKVRNPNRHTRYGIGFLGVGNYENFLDNKIICGFWERMLRRCYNPKFDKSALSYKNCTVTEEWHNFQNFAAWFEKNYNPKTMDGWHLDKDILKKGNKIYGPDTCCFVPPQINSLLVKSDASRGELPIGVSKWRTDKFQAYLERFGKRKPLGIFDTVESAFQAYKVAKEGYIKEVANIWMDRIATNTYKALVDYQVDITD